MGKSETDIFPRGQIDCQQMHEKKLNITNHQGNVNQNNNELSPHTCKNGYYQKIRDNKC